MFARQAILRLLIVVFLVTLCYGCGGSKSQPTKPGKIDPAAVKQHDAKVEEEEAKQRQREEQSGK